MITIYSVRGQATHIDADSVMTIAADDIYNDVVITMKDGTVIRAPPGYGGYLHQEVDRIKKEIETQKLDNLTTTVINLIRKEIYGRIGVDGDHSEKL